MSDSTITKVNSAHSPRGQHGEKYLASGQSVSMRLWENEQSGEAKEPVARESEVVGYVIARRAELHHVVPKGAAHTYKILESFTAVEATHPPAQAHGRDE